MDERGGRELDWPEDSAVDVIFAEFIERRDSGEEIGVETLCAEHPELADPLRRAHAFWLRFEEALQSSSNPLTESLARAARAGAELETPSILESESIPRVRRVLGRGGMGLVLEVYEPELDRTLAMKVLREDGSTQDSAGARRVARFLEEARITGRLQHPGVVPIHHLGLDEEGRAWFTMPLVEGRTFGEIVELARAEQEGWTLTRAVGALLRVCETMAYAHERGVVHRDLKPANVMVGSFGETYVMDWGLARELDRADAHDLRVRALERVGLEDESAEGLRPLATMDGDVIGTPAYMPPEQARGEREALHTAADVYALGAMLYHLLAGAAPYAGAAHAYEVLARVVSGPPQPLGELAPHAPAPLIAIAERAMQRDPKQRYARTQELADELRAWSEGRVVRSYESGGWAEIRSWVRRNKLLAASGASGLILLVFGAVSVLNWWLARASVQRIEDYNRVQELLTEAPALYPALPHRAADMRAWLSRAEDVVSRAAVHRAHLATLDGDPPTTEFGVWAHDKQRGLGDGLDELTRVGGVMDALQERLAYAEGVYAWTITEHQDAWDASVELAANPTGPYAGLQLQEQIGFVPLGPDPQSGLLEFALHRTGRVPSRDAEGRLWVAEEDAMVFVLIPGGEARIGMNPEREPWSNGMFESPEFTLRLHPYMISKYEMTLAQWRRSEGREPVVAPAELERPGITPVSGISVPDCRETLGRMGLVLPTEPQWEHAARGGVDSPWPWGPYPAVLPDYLHNALELSPMARPIGVLPANGYGLHNALDNVGEWCRGEFGRYRDIQFRPGDGQRVDAESGKGMNHVFRGRNFLAIDPANALKHTRVSWRFVQSPDTRQQDLGVRPVCRLVSGDDR